MDTVEIEGNSIDEAIENALKALGTERAKVEIEILANSTRGLFGLGGKKARVRATVRRPLDTNRSAPLPPPKGTPPEPRSAPQVEPRASVPEGGPSRSVPSVQAAREPRVDPNPRPASDGAVEHARRVLEELVVHMGFVAVVDARSEADHALLSVSGDSSNVLIGKYGQTLDALEYLVNRIVAREEDASPRFVVDCEQYRVKRQQSLEQLARRLAERAKKRGKPVTMNPMSPRDRRIVHLALQADPQLTTRSSGTGYYRKLLIIPEGERRSGASRGQ
jgi:spoIIIJ-associated protein